MKPIKKAYRINENHMSDCFRYFCDASFIAYGTEGQAKSQIVSHYQSEETLDGEELNMMNVRVLRAKEYDKYEFRGKEETKEKIDYILEKEERDSKLDNILKENPNAKAFVYSGIRGGYWGENHCGYHSDKFKAGVYTLKEAVAIVKSSCLSRNESVEMIDPITHNKEVLDKIEKLKSYLV